MFTEKKFRSLDPQLQYKKAAKILKESEKAVLSGEQIDLNYLKMILSIAAENTGEFQKQVISLTEQLDSPSFSWAINSLKYKFLDKAGIQSADWDMLDIELPQTERKILPISVFLENLRSPFNVGSIFRTAASFCFQEILLSPDTPTPDQPRARRSAMGTDSRISWRQTELKDLSSAKIFALETDGTPIDEFEFPENGIMILGSEETGISPEALEIAENSGGIVSIPMYGIKKSINVGVAFGIAAYCWSDFILRKTRTEL